MDTAEDREDRKDRDAVERSIQRAAGMRLFTKDAGDRWIERHSRAADRCRRHRLRILEVARKAGAAHVSPAFSCVEIVDALYHGAMRSGDVFIMSKGHGCLAQYAVLEDKYDHLLDCKVCGGSGFSTPGTGYGNVCSECIGGRTGPRPLDKYCRPEGRLGAHPDYAPDLGIHASTGSLGHGLGIAAGQALAERMRGTDARVYVLLSDGECQEGSTWEAAMVAANLRLDNLVALVDANDWGGMEQMSKTFPALNERSSLAAKFRAFGWGAREIDGHDWSAVSNSAYLPPFEPLPLGLPGPRAVICQTVKGKGVSFMEAGQPLWHYRAPTDAEYAQAVRELEVT